MYKSCSKPFILLFLSAVPMLNKGSLWFHAAIIHIFQPFIGGDQYNERLKTFTDEATTIRAACGASLTQLKQLIINYCLYHKSSTLTILWHTALIYMINMLYSGNGDEDRHQYLLVCLSAYQRLSHSWRLAKSLVKGLLSLGRRKGGLTSSHALGLLRLFEIVPHEQISAEISAPFVLDQTRAASDPSTATAEYLANELEGDLDLIQYTTVMDEE